MYASWQEYKTLPCTHSHAHIHLYGRYVCMGCASPNIKYNTEKITMGLTHELQEMQQGLQVGPDMCGVNTGSG